MMSVQALEQQFSLHNQVTFEQINHEIILLNIDNDYATATVSLFGGQVIKWQPKSQRHPVLWQSDLVAFSLSKPIRAGVPICWPWFGAHPTLNPAPSHGFARMSDWNIRSISTNADGATEIFLSMQQHPFDASQGRIHASLDIKISIGETLVMELITINTGQTPIVYTEALHAYFTVSDIAQIEINGLHNFQYVDLIDVNTLKTQIGAVQFTQELGRVYVDTESVCAIHDPGLDRVIQIEKTGSQSTVVWNPWLETASNMPDLGPEAWRQMVCVESANALHNTVCLDAGQQHAIRVVYAVKPDSTSLL